MKSFIEDFTCVSKVHCQTCRDKTKVGKSFRESLLRVFVLPGDETEFSCPHGRPWGWQKPSSGLGDTIGKIANAIGIKECGGCKKRKEALNKLVPYKK